MRNSSFKQVVIPLVALLMANVARAECGTYYCDGARIIGMTTAAAGQVYVQVSGTVANLNCSPLPGGYLTLVPANPGFDRIYAVLLAHQLGDKPLMVRIDEGSAGCTISYVYTTA